MPSWSGSGLAGLYARPSGRTSRLPRGFWRPREPSVPPTRSGPRAAASRRPSPDGRQPRSARRRHARCGGRAVRRGGGPGAVRGRRGGGSTTSRPTVIRVRRSTSPVRLGARARGRPQPLGGCSTSAGSESGRAHGRSRHASRARRPAHTVLREHGGARPGLRWRGFCARRLRAPTATSWLERATGHDPRHRRRLRRCGRARRTPPGATGDGIALALPCRCACSPIWSSCSSTRRRSAAGSPSGRLSCCTEALRGEGATLGGLTRASASWSGVHARACPRAARRRGACHRRRAPSPRPRPRSTSRCRGGLDRERHAPRASAASRPACRERRASTPVPGAGPGRAGRALP